MESFRAEAEAEFDLIPGEYGAMGDWMAAPPGVPGQAACPFGRAGDGLLISSPYGEVRSARESRALVAMEVRGAWRL